MKKKIKLLKKINLDNFGTIVSQSLNKTYQNFKKNREKEIAQKIKKKKN